MRRLINIYAILISVGSSYGWAQGIEYVGSTLWSGANDVEVVGNYAYYAFDNGLIILDVSSLNQPAFLSKVYINAQALKITVGGRYAYLVCSGSGLVIIDISDPLNPTVAGTYDPGSVYDVDVVGNYAYVANGDSTGLQILNISNPSSPVLIGAFPVATYCPTAKVQGNYAYILDWRTLKILDVSNPSGPALIGSLLLNLILHPNELTVRGDYAYLVGEPGGLYIVDISDPANPTLVEYTRRGDFVDISLAGNYAYLAAEMEGGGSSGLVIFDISDPANPTPRGRGFNEFVSLSGIDVRDSIAYVTDNYFGIFNIDMANIDTPIVLGHYETPGSINSISGTDDIVCVGTDALLYTVGLDDPSRPTVLGSLPSIYTSWQVIADGNNAFVGDGDGVLRSIDISDPSNPHESGSCQLDGFVQDMEKEENYIYVGAGGLDIVDISNPANPFLAGSFITGGWEMKVSVLGNYAYLVPQQQALYVLDISNPLHPDSIAAYDSTDMGFGQVFSFEHYVYVEATYVARILDVSNPANPVVVNVLPSRLVPYAVVGNYMYAAGTDSAYNSCLKVMDITDPVNPREISNYILPLRVQDLFVAGDLIYVSNAHSLIILRFSPNEIDDKLNLPQKISLSQNFPNPFNARTSIRYTLFKAGPVNLSIYNLLGQKVATLYDKVQSAGEHSINWDAAEFTSGVYFARLESNDESRNIKIVLLK